MTRSRDVANIDGILTAKGDIYAATAAATPARLGVGANGDTIVADSSTATGLRYQAPVNANPVINSAMQVWQRGTSIACTTTSYTADRWQGYRGVAGATVSRQATGDTTNLPFIQYCARVQRDSGNTSTSAIYLAQSFESINSIPYAGKTVTLSFYARAGANFTNGFAARLYTGTGTDQNQLASYTGAANPIAQGTTLTTTWQRFSYTATLATTATELAIRFDYEPTGTAGANDYYEITGVQLEVGSVATPFKTIGTYQQELAACQRYYTRLANVGSATEYWFGSGYAGTTTQAQCILPLTSTMRSSTITLDYSGVRLQDYGAGYAISALIYVSSARNNIVVGATSSGLTANRPLAIDTNTTGYIGISAEL